MNKKLQNFSLAYNALPVGLKKEAREKIKTDCFLMNDNQFYNRKSGRVRISEYQAARIINIFLRYGIDAFTGNVLDLAG